MEVRPVTPAEFRATEELTREAWWSTRESARAAGARETSWRSAAEGGPSFDGRFEEFQG